VSSRWSASVAAYRSVCETPPVASRRRAGRRPRPVPGPRSVSITPVCAPPPTGGRALVAVELGVQAGEQRDRAAVDGLQQPRRCSRARPVSLASPGRPPAHRPGAHFVPDTEAVLKGLEHLDRLRVLWQGESR
jgi:hypothetical protein